eukprot:5327192-Lingulodinium_polyedra.AAC.1
MLESSFTQGGQHDWQSKKGKATASTCVSFANKAAREDATLGHPAVDDVVEVAAEVAWWPARAATVRH